MTEEELAAKWIAVAMSTDPIDKKRIEAAVGPFYTHCLKSEPPARVVFVGSPHRLIDGDPCPKGKFSECSGGVLDVVLASSLEMSGEQLGPADEAIVEMAATAGWCRFFKEACFVSERPVRISLNEEGEFHHLTALAVEYADGNGFAFVDGVSVPREWIDTRLTVDPRAVLAHPTADERALWCKVVGWDRILEATRARVLDTDPTHTDPDAPADYGQLLEADMGPGLGRTKFLRARCGTGRMVVIPLIDCPATTARAANAWSYSWDEAQDGPFELGRRL